MEADEVERRAFFERARPNMLRNGNSQRPTVGPVLTDFIIKVTAAAAGALQLHCTQQHCSCLSALSELSSELPGVLYCTVLLQLQ